MGAIMGGNVRVGLEDSLYAGAGKLATSNAEQVTIVRNILEGLSLDVAKPAEARQPGAQEAVATSDLARRSGRATVAVRDAASIGSRVQEPLGPWRSSPASGISRGWRVARPSSIWTSREQASGQSSAQTERRISIPAG